MNLNPSFYLLIIMYRPESAYRIQFHKGFTFSDLEKIIPYLNKLGIKTIFASPIFAAMAGRATGMTEQILTG